MHWDIVDGRKGRKAWSVAWARKGLRVEFVAARMIAGDFGVTDLVWMLWVAWRRGRR